MAVDFDAQIQQQNRLFRQALTTVDPAARVPTCPDWSATELLGHLAGVHWWWATIVENRITDPGDIDEHARNGPSDHSGLLRYFDEQAQRLSALLDTTDDDVAVWTWSHNHSVGFIRRRMAHEALIHRLDAELTAAAAVSPVDPDLAADGVDELLTYFFGGPAWSTFTSDGPVGLVHATDTGTQWLVQVGSVSGVSPDGERSYDREPAFRRVQDTDAGGATGPATFTVQASAPDLDAWLWRRPPGREVAIEGAQADAAVFVSIIGEGID
jgi:uncharacterized protein (TIGR03083 family)